ncbi:MAG: type III-A CRISPR-associated protein Csm2 [Anaerohalosphaeraceae bacterium]
MSQQKHSYSGGHGNRETQNRHNETIPLPDVIYYDSSGNMPVQLLSDWAEAWAKSFPEKKLSKNQIRRFFGAIKNLHFQLDSGRPWEQILPLFKMFLSKVSYAEKAVSKKIPSEFANFLKIHIKKVGSSEKNFRAFVLFFEAVLGFAYGYDKIGGKE